MPTSVVKTTFFHDFTTMRSNIMYLQFNFQITLIIHWISNSENSLKHIKMGGQNWKLLYFNNRIFSNTLCFVVSLKLKNFQSLHLDFFDCIIFEKMSKYEDLNKCKPYDQDSLQTLFPSFSETTKLCSYPKNWETLIHSS